MLPDFGTGAPGIFGHTDSEVSAMNGRRPVCDENLRISPECRLCPLYDSCSIREFPVAAPGEMGMRVLDNCAEEHMQ